MRELTHVIERKEFVQNEGLKQEYKDGNHIYNIISREEFVKDEELKSKYNNSTLPVLESSHDVELLGKDEKVLGFEEYVKRFKKAEKVV